jgi:prophage protein
MPASQLNRVETALKISEKIDQRAVEKSCTAWMTAGAKDFEFKGNGTFRIPSIRMSGLGDYRKDLGYPMGSVTMTYKDYTCEYDRSRSFTLDSQEVDESNFVVSAARSLSIFIDEYVIPEIDALRFAKLCAIANEKSHATTGYTPAKADIYSKLLNAMYAVKDSGSQEVVAHVSSEVLAALGVSSEFQHILRQDDFNAGRLYSKVTYIDDMPLILTPKSRFYSAIDLYDGITAGEEGGGYKKSSAGKDINFIVVGKDVPAAIEKHSVKNIIPPGDHTCGDSWFFATRVYHDLLVKETKKDGVYINTK